MSKNLFQDNVNVSHTPFCRFSGLVMERQFYLFSHQIPAMKKICCSLLFVIVMMPSILRAQKISEETVKMGKQSAACFVAAIKHEKDDVQAALIAELEKAGLKKAKKKKKFYRMMGVEWPSVSSGKLDLYYKVSGKRHKSKIYFVASKGYDNYITNANDAGAASAINAFLSGINAAVEHNIEIKNKEAEVQQMNEKLEKEKQDMKKAEENKRKKEKELEEMKKK